MNSINVIGRLTRDIELKYTNSGLAIGKISIATDEYMGKDKEKWTNFFECTLFGKQAEGLAPYLLKGKQIGVSGNLHQDRWQTDDGNRSKVVIKVQNIKLVGDRTNETKRTGGGSDPKNFEDDIPY